MPLHNQQQQPSDGQDWIFKKDEYISWATSEFVKGRDRVRVKVSTAKQASAAMSRLIKFLGEHKEENWLGYLECEKVMEYVYHLTSLHRSPKYIASEVVMAEPSVYYVF